MAGRGNSLDKGLVRGKNLERQWEVSGAGALGQGKGVTWAAAGGKDSGGRGAGIVGFKAKSVHVWGPLVPSATGPLAE